MLLCAGHGTRLAPLTDHLPKPLVPVCNRPLLLYNLLLLRSAGVSEVVINLHHLGDLIPEVLGDGRDLGMSLRYSEERELLGTGGGLHAVRDFLGTGTCLVANGDTLCDADLGGVLARHLERGALATMVLHPHERPEAWGAVRLGPEDEVIGIDHVTRREDVEERGAHVFSGIQVLEPAFFERLDAEPSCVVRTAWRRLIDEAVPVYGDPAVSRFHDCGTPERLLAATRTLLSEPDAFAHAPRPPHQAPEGAGRVRQPVLFGPDVVLGEGAEVGPDVVLGQGVRVAPRVRVSDSTVWPGVELTEDVVGEVVG